MKPDMTLLPPGAILAMADVMTRANTPEKHQDAKWKRMTPEEHIAAALRHIFAWLGGEKLDPELGTSHLANGSVRLSMALAREIGHSATASSDTVAGEPPREAVEPWWQHQDEHGWKHMTLDDITPAEWDAASAKFYASRDIWAETKV